MTRQRHAQGHVERLLAHGGAVANAHEKRIQIDNGVDGVDRAALPRLRSLQDGIGDFADKLWRNVRAVDLLEIALNLPRRHAASVERENFLIEARQATNILGNDLRRKTAVSVSRDVNRQRAALGLDRLVRVPVSVVRTTALLDLVAFRVPEMIFHLDLEQLLHERFLNS